jgi:hypothetical protein
MTALTPEEKAARARQRMLDKAREYSTGTYIRRFVAPLFQRMIRAEAAAYPAASVPVVVDDGLRAFYRRLGECVCITCGKAAPWSSGLGGMHTGHFLASRRNSILFEEANVAPQCSRCNRYENGAPQRFRQWMLAVRGADIVERLERLKATTRQFTREELVDMRIEYAARLKAAEERMRA